MSALSCPDQPGPLDLLVPHHINGYAAHGTTALDETVLMCEHTHHDIHEGKRTIQLRDGRWINENGITTAPPWADDPPF